MAEVEEGGIACIMIDSHLFKTGELPPLGKTQDLAKTLSWDDVARLPGRTPISSPSRSPGLSASKSLPALGAGRWRDNAEGHASGSPPGPVANQHAQHAGHADAGWSVQADTSSGASRIQQPIPFPPVSPLFSSAEADALGELDEAAPLPYSLPS